MDKRLRSLLDKPGNDLIVVPFHIQRGWGTAGFVAIKAFGIDMWFIRADYFDRDQYPPGSCVQ